MVTQSLALGQAVVLALLVRSNRITPLDLLLLSLFLGVVTAFDLPARQALVPTLLDRQDDLANAISLNSSLVNATRLWGPAIAGMLVAAAGEAWCFLLNAFSYLATLAALVMLRLPPRAECGPQADFWSHWKQGLVYAFGHRAIRQVLGLLAIASLVATPAGTLMPAVVRGLHGGPRLLGALLAASAFGALVGGLAMASAGIKAPGDLRRLIIWAAVALASAIIAFSLTKGVWLALCCQAVAGLGFMIVMAASNTWLQLSVSEGKRARLMSLFSMALFGTTPLGCLLAGFLADRLGLYPTIRLGGFICLAVVAYVGLGSGGSAPQVDADSLADSHSQP